MLLANRGRKRLPQSIPFPAGATFASFAEFSKQMEDAGDKKRKVCESDDASEGHGAPSDVLENEEDTKEFLKSVRGLCEEECDRRISLEDEALAFEALSLLSECAERISQPNTPVVAPIRNVPSLDSAMSLSYVLSPIR
mmetsp:Transcript_24815/g.81597  ORF Transcript_24815/g.81597 Transcript_24815/m.81597 type:complete len:139 (-) Transcript_24815:1244-1660(-)